MMRNWIVLIVWGCIIGRTFGIRFIIDKQECFSHKAEYGDIVHYSFVVIEVDGSSQYNEGVDLVVKEPSGELIQRYHNKISEKNEFTVRYAGLYHFCFANKSPHHETIDFDIHATRFAYHEEHAKDEHLKPLYEHIGKLEEALYSIQFEQHYQEAQTDRQSIANEGMSKRVIHKAFFESATLVGASVLQVYLLRRLIEQKVGRPRV